MGEANKKIEKSAQVLLNSYLTNKEEEIIRAASEMSYNDVIDYNIILSAIYRLEERKTTYILRQNKHYKLLMAIALVGFLYILLGIMFALYNDFVQNGGMNIPFLFGICGLFSVMFSGIGIIYMQLRDINRYGKQSSLIIETSEMKFLRNWRNIEKLVRVKAKEHHSGSAIDMIKNLENLITDKRLTSEDYAKLLSIRNTLIHGGTADDLEEAITLESYIIDNLKIL